MAPTSKTQQPKPFPLRMPAQTRVAITEAAARNFRSVNSEIVGRLEASLKERRGRATEPH